MPSQALRGSENTRKSPKVNRLPAKRARATRNARVKAALQPVKHKKAAGKRRQKITEFVPIPEVENNVNTNKIPLTEDARDKAKNDVGLNLRTVDNAMKMVWQTVHPQRARNFVRIGCQFVTLNQDPADCPVLNEELCFICQQIAPYPLQRIHCTSDGCKSWYHNRCLSREKMHDFYIHMAKRNQIKCPKHFCHGCFSRNLRTSAFLKERTIMQCKCCFRGYHKQCRPPGFGNEPFICPSHLGFPTYGLPHSPFCFNCKKYFENDEEDGIDKEQCDFCLRAYHKTCGQFMVDNKPGMGNRMCVYCRCGWFPRENENVHVFMDGDFMPGTVSHHLTRPGFIPISFPHIMEKVFFIHTAMILPYTMFDAFRTYYTFHLSHSASMEHYLNYCQSMDEGDVAALPLAKRLEHREDNVFHKSQKRSIEDAMEDIEMEAVRCDCKVKPGAKFKCMSEECYNRRHNVECRPECGAKCMNRRKSRDPDPKLLEVFESRFRGKGLRARAQLVKGFPIGEYRGQIISKQTMASRMTAFVEERNTEDPFYIMRFGCRNVFVDCKLHGSITRYANHSCDPNCVMQTVTGQDTSLHLMLYAKRDIAAGEEITFDYSMCWDEYNPLCYCGTSACTGYMSSTMRPSVKRTNEEYEAGRNAATSYRKKVRDSE